LTLNTTPFVYGGISFRQFGSGNSERYFARRVTQMFRNSNPEVFCSKELLITEGTNLHVLVKYQDEWCFCRVPDALREPVKNFGEDAKYLLRVRSFWPRREQHRALRRPLLTINC
jgi:hypothetical protein